MKDYYLSNNNSEVIREIFSLGGAPCHPEVADRVERHVRMPNGDVMRTYVRLEHHREPEDGDVLTVEYAAPKKSTPESKAAAFDHRASYYIANLLTRNSSKEMGRVSARSLAGEEDSPAECAYSQLDPRFQTEERRLLVEEVRWLAEQQIFETSNCLQRAR